MPFIFYIKSQPITYELLRSVSSTDEGNQFTITLNATGLDTGTTVPYTLSGISSADIDNASLTGNFVLSGTKASSTATITFTVSADITAEGPETFTISLDNGLASAEVLINDTSAASSTAQYTTLLLKGNGTNNAQNNTFVDSGPNNSAITLAGDVKQGSFSPFSPAGWSGYFDGTSTLTTPNTSAFDFSGSGDFTIEAWVYNAGPGTYRGICGARPNGSPQGWCVFISATNTLKIGAVNTGYSYEERQLNTATIAPNTWTHIAVVKTASGYTGYVNGGGDALTAVTGGLQYMPAQQLVIGALGSQGEYPFSGHINGLRITKSAVYTSDFTPATGTVAALANTQLLTLQQNRFDDQSANALVFGVTGAPKVSAFSPFAPSAEYSPALHGGSAYFDGVGDALTFPTISLNGDFTVEAWVYYSPNPAGQYINLLSDTTDNVQFTIDWDGSTVVLQGTIGIYTGRIAKVSGAGVLKRNSWNHLAWTRQGSAIKMFANGTLSASATDSGLIRISTIGRWMGSGYHLYGYLSNLMIDASTAKYTANFTPPTSPVTATASTNLLLNFTNAGIVDSSGKVDLKTVGNTKISTTQSKFGGSSIYFDGTGDFLSLPYDDVSVRLGTGDFTVEAWVYPTTSTGLRAILVGQCDLASAAGSSFTFNIGPSANSDLYVGTGPYSVTSPNPPANQWSHVAWVRGGGFYKSYLNGVQVGSVAIPVTASVNNGYASYPASIGAYQNSGSAFTGYIDDLRVTKGIARYPDGPTAAFPDSAAGDPYYSNVSLLLHSDGTNESTTFVDSSQSPKALTAYGQAKISTARTKWGTGSIYIPADNSYVSAPSSADFALGTGDFTIESWVFLTANNIYQTIFTIGNYTNGLSFQLYHPSAGAIAVYCNGQQYVFSQSVITLNTWHHVALVRNTGIVTVYVDSMKFGTSQSMTQSIAQNSITIGMSPHAATERVFGYIDDLRVTKGVARYDGTFTPPGELLS